MNYIELNKAIYALDSTFNQNTSLQKDEHKDKLFFLDFKKDNPKCHYLKGICGKTFEGEKVLVVCFEQKFHHLFYKNLNSLTFKIKKINLEKEEKKILTVELNNEIFIFSNLPQIIIEEYEIKKLIDVSLHNKIKHCGQLFEFIL